MGLRAATVNTQTQPALAFDGQRGITVRHEASGLQVRFLDSSTPRPEVLVISRSSIPACHTRRVTNLHEWDT
ncbi:hypothetical protein GCM10009836_14230 [Pseudonocardia ailaonensis]|uniref:Uncharacterized protein n=1 Tax=Pseudonocardia ailaonensis TaxID=367279 RepID=A0ABN2MS55_9PSEU